jgi:hypothetical protein
VIREFGAVRGPIMRVKDLGRVVEIDGGPHPPFELSTGNLQTGALPRDAWELILNRKASSINLVSGFQAAQKRSIL